MPLRTEVKIEGLREVLKLARTLPGGANAAMRAVGVETLEAARRAVLRNLSGRYPGPNLEHVVAVRTGGLRRYVSATQAKVERGGLAWGLQEGSKESKIGLTLEEGGEVKSTRGYLRIPLPAACTAQGVDRNAGVAFRGMSSQQLRDQYKLIPWKSRGGNLLLMHVTGLKKSTRLTPWYVLRKSVNIRARNWFSAGVEEAKAALPAAEAARMTELLRRSKGGA